MFWKWVTVTAWLPVTATLTACGAEAARTQPEPTESRAALVRTLIAEHRSVTQRASLPADLWPMRRAVLAAEVPGVVEELSFEEGDAVRSGELLARIDTRSLRQALAEVEALYRQANAEAERAATLFEKRSITRTQLDAAVTEREVAQARLASARLQLQKSEVRAPWSGTVAVKRVEAGDYVMPGQPVVELLEMNRLKVRAPAPASDVPYLRIGSPVAIEVEAFPGEPFPGRVVRLGAELDRQARTLSVEAEISNPDRRLRPGMLARMEISLREMPQALLVPLAAVVDFEREKALYVVEEGRAIKRTVELGPVLGQEVVVERGLQPGERVIVEGQQQVADGQPVTEG